MAFMTRVTDFVSGTVIESAVVDAEFNQIVGMFGGTTNKDVKFIGKTFNQRKDNSSDTTTFATGANTTETSFQSYTIPAGALSANGDFLDFEVYGLTAANGNTKRLRARIAITAPLTGGTLVLDTGAVAYAGGWHMWMRFTRLSNTTVRVQTRFLATRNAGNLDNSNINTNTITPVTVNNLDSLTNIIEVSATNGTAAANDITSNLLNVFTDNLG